MSYGIRKWRGQPRKLLVGKPNKAPIKMKENPRRKPLGTPIKSAPQAEHVPPMAFGDLPSDVQRRHMASLRAAGERRD